MCDFLAFPKHPGPVDLLGPASNYCRSVVHGARHFIQEETEAISSMPARSSAHLARLEGCASALAGSCLWRDHAEECRDVMPGRPCHGHNIHNSYKLLAHGRLACQSGNAAVLLTVAFLNCISKYTNTSKTTPGAGDRAAPTRTRQESSPQLLEKAPKLALVRPAEQRHSR